MNQTDNNTLLYPKLAGAHIMTAAELNAVRLSERRTVLTPEDRKSVV